MPISKKRFDQNAKIELNRHMYLGFRKNLIVSCIVISLFHLALFVAGSYFIFKLDIMPDVLGDLAEPAPAWLFAFSTDEPAGLRLNALVGIAALVFISVLMNLGVRSRYRRTDSPELLFVMLFCLSLCPEVWRLGNLLFPALGLPRYLSVLVTRVVLFSRFFGLLCLLASSLYAAGMNYTRYPILIGGTVVLAFTLAGILPLDTSIYEATFLYKLGDRQGYLFILTILAVVMTIDFLIAARVRGSSRFVVVAGACVFLFGGRELLQQGVAPLPIVLGFVLLVAGAVVFVRQVVVFYLGI